MKTIVQLVTELKTYFLGKDTAAKQAVEANIAPVETDASAASQGSSAGSQLFLNDVLYDVIAPISANDALVVGTNIQAADDLSTQIAGAESGLANEAATRSAMGAKNLLPINVTSQIKAGITFTVTDNEITAMGTATGADGAILLVSKIVLPVGNYIMTGGLSNNAKLLLAKTGQANKWDTGSGLGFISDGGEYEVYMHIPNTGNEVNVTYYPMIRLASDIDDTYQPYAKTNKELTDDVSSLNSAIANKENTPTVLTQTLAASATTLTFTDASIGNNSRIRAYSDPFVLGLITDMTQSGTNVTLTCAAQANSVSVKLEVRN